MKIGESIERNKYVFALLAIIFFLMLLAHHAAGVADEAHTKILDFCLQKGGEVIAAFLTLVVAGKAMAEPSKHDSETVVTASVATDKK